MTLNSPETRAKRNAKRRAYTQTLGKTIKRRIRKKCQKCGKVGECGFTGFTSNGGPLYRRICLVCHRLKEKEYRLRRRKHLNRRALERKKKRKIRMIQYLGGACINCGYSRCPRALTFHHKDRITKEYSLSQIADWSWAKITRELDKCVLLCFNCHMEIESDYELMRGISYAISNLHKSKSAR